MKSHILGDHIQDIELPEHRTRTWFTWINKEFETQIPVIDDIILRIRAHEVNEGEENNNNSQRHKFHRESRAIQQRTQLQQQSNYYSILFGVSEPGLAVSFHSDGPANFSHFSPHSVHFFRVLFHGISFDGMNVWSVYSQRD